MSENSGNDRNSEKEFTAGGGIGAGIGDQVSEDKLLRLFADGATIVLQGLHRTWAPVRELSQGLAADLGHPVQVNAYITPPQNQGFSDHYDVHDVFVLQVHGEKQWSLREPVLDHPLRDQPWGERSAEVGARAGEPAHLETTLRPDGDGRGRLLIRSGDAGGMAVSLEPAGGSEQPTTTPVLAVTYS